MQAQSFFQKAPTTREETSVEILLVTTGQTLLAIRARQIVRLQNYDHQALMPSANGGPTSLVGLVNWKGSYLPLIDLARLLGLPPGDSAQTGQQILVFERQGFSFGFLVQVAQQIERIVVTDIKLLPPLVEENRLKPAVWALWQRGPSQLIPLVDPVAALESGDLELMEQSGKLAAELFPLNFDKGY